MKIFKVGTSVVNRINFQLKFRKVFFSFSWDHLAISLCIGPIGIKKEWWEGWNILPRKSDYFADNTYKGRLRRLIHWE